MLIFIIVEDKTETETDASCIKISYKLFNDNIENNNNLQLITL